MGTMLMNSENSKSSDSHRLLLTFPDKIDVKRSHKHVVLTHFSIYYTWRNVKSHTNTKHLKMSAPTCNEKLELRDESYYILDIQWLFQTYHQKPSHIYW